MALPDLSIITDYVGMTIDLFISNYLIAGPVLAVIAGIVAFLIIRRHRKKPAAQKQAESGAPSPPPQGAPPETHAFAPQEKSTLSFYQKRAPAFDDVERVEVMMEIVGELEKHFYTVHPDELAPEEKKWYDKIKKGIESIKVALDYGEMERAKRNLSSLEMHVKMFDMAIQHKNS
jgi:hypothetical protein